jgi:glycosyltransferase involved in cell wall biosynthesis
LGIRLLGSKLQEISSMASPRVAVILPCYNEGVAIGGVVRSFRAALPAADIYVFDNNSEDDTATEALAAGAMVRRVHKRGKGNVVRQAFAQVEADVYIIADGDGTYDAASAPMLVAALWQDRLDMVVGRRENGDDQSAYRGGHQLGNKLFNWLVHRLFGDAFADIFSGYRGFSRPFVKSFPALATGFETETEMSLHAIQLGLACIEIPTSYGRRCEASHSKLRTYRDGARILWYLLRLLKQTRPLFLFAVLAAISAFTSLALGASVVLEFLETGLVPRLPTAVAAASLMVMSGVSFATGLILDSLAYTQQETKRLAYLSISRIAPHREAAQLSRHAAA